MTTTPQTNTDLREIAGILRDRDNFVICGHVSPDGDCIGSQLALWYVLRAIGKTATCILVKDEGIPGTLDFLPGSCEMVPACRFNGPADVFVGVDVPTRERIGEDACAILDACTTSITVDHHACATTMCEFVYVDPDSASASILIWELAKMLVGTPTADCAMCAYTGLITDTGGFRFQNTDPRAFAVASDLVAHGVDPSHAATCAFQSRSMASLRLEELAIKRMKLASEGRVAISWVTLSDLDQFGASKSDAEPIIDVLRSLSGIRVACMLREQDGVIRGNLRSKDTTDVSVLAIELGGGGHKAAAGFTLDTDLETAITLLEQKLCALVEERAE